MTNKQTGFSLIELMIGMVIGLIAALVITNVLTKYEQQKRSSTGSSDAQTNGAIALYNIQRDMESAGWGLPTFGDSLSPFLCPLSNVAANNTEINHDNDAGTPNIGLSPVMITDNTGTNASDIISIRLGDTMKSGGEVKVTNPGANILQVNNNIGCNVGDVAVVMREANPQLCQLTRVTAVSPPAALPFTVTLDATTAPAAVQIGDAVACLGAWNEHQYAIGDGTATGGELNQLTRTGALSAAGMPVATPVAIVPDIVSIQARYGVTANLVDNIVVGYVDATGIFGPAMTRNNRNRIKSIQVAVVARSGLREPVAVSQACTGADPSLARVCIWNNGTDVDLTALADWANYRYRVYETIIPLRNVMWSRKVIQDGVANNL
jgi:type IV pilus assembly protein PilW